MGGGAISKGLRSAIALRITVVPTRARAPHLRTWSRGYGSAQCAACKLLSSGRNLAPWGGSCGVEVGPVPRETSPAAQGCAVSCAAAGNPCECQLEIGLTGPF